RPQPVGPGPAPVGPVRPRPPAWPVEREQPRDEAGSNRPAVLDGLRSAPSVPAADLGPGELLWTIGGSGAPIVMSPAELRGDHWAFSGAIEPVSVADTRPGNLPWTLTGQVSDFVGGLPAHYLGWTPRVVAHGGGVFPGAP